MVNLVSLGNSIICSCDHRHLKKYLTGSLVVESVALKSWDQLAFLQVSGSRTDDYSQLVVWGHLVHVTQNLTLLRFGALSFRS